jgi:hypothetical protein
VDVSIGQKLILDFKSCIALHHLFCISINLYLVEVMSISMYILKSFVSSYLYKQGNLFPLVKLLCIVSL